MECESNAIVTKLLEGLIKQVVNEVRGEDIKVLAEIARDLNEIRDQLKMLANRMESAGMAEADSEMVFGFWRRGDTVFMYDRRLWDREKYPNAPFKSRDAIQRVSKNNPNLFVKNSQGYNTAFAGDLYDFICNQSVRDLMDGKGIRTNKKRK